MRRFLSVGLFAVGLASVGLPALADTHWVCGLSQEGVQLVCVADPDSLEVAPEGAAASSPAAVVRGTRFPLDPHDMYTVELWSVPDDPQWLEQLARATICYRSSGCTVSVAPVQGLDNSRTPWVTARWR